MDNVIVLEQSGHSESSMFWFLSLGIPACFTRHRRHKPHEFFIFIGNFHQLVCAPMATHGVPRSSLVRLQFVNGLHFSSNIFSSSLGMFRFPVVKKLLSCSQKSTKQLLATTQRLLLRNSLSFITSFFIAGTAH